MCRLPRLLTVAAACSLAASLPLAAAENAAPAKTVRLLAVGNSFSANALRYLPQIVAHSGKGQQLILDHEAIGGCSLQRHWANAEAFEKDPNAPASKPTGKGLRERLQADRWDYVTLQQYSMDSGRPETYRPHAPKLRDYIKQYAPQAEIVFHETWAYRADDPGFRADFTQNDMYRQLRQAYDGIARELGCRLIPVGDAFRNAERDSAWGNPFPVPGFVPATAVFPALPDQHRSLHAGFGWSDDGKGGHRLGYDGHHAGTAGEYLAAAVWYEFLFRDSVLGNPFVPPGLSAADVAILQQVAHRTVSGGVRPPLP